MAITTGTPVESKHSLIRFKDAQNHFVTYGCYLTAHSDDNVLNTFQENYAGILARFEALCNVAVVKAILEETTTTVFTSDKTPETAQFATNDQILALNFERANPLKPGSVLNSTVILPAYKVNKASLDFPNVGVPKIADSDLAALIDYFEKRLTERYIGNGQLYNGFTHVLADDGGISVPAILQG